MSSRYSENRKLLSARVGSLVLDSLLIGYVLWCVSFLEARTCGVGFLTRFPELLVSGVVLAVIWQTTGASLGQRGYRLRFESRGGGPAARGHRLAWGFYAALGILVLLFLVHASSQTLGALGLACALACALGLAALASSDGRSIPERAAGLRLTITRQEDTGPIRPWYRRPNAWAILGILFLTFSIGFSLTEFSLGALMSNMDRTAPIVERLTSPDWSITGDVIDKLIETVFLAFMASVLSLPLAFLISFLGARNLTRGSALGRIAYSLTRLFMNITRSIEPLIWAIIFIVWVGVGPFSGMLALFIHSVAALGKLYSEAIESIDTGPVEAVQATGASYAQVLRFGVVPQVIPAFLAFTMYRWDINVRMATVLGLIGAGGIGGKLIDYTQLGAWNKLGTVMLFITLVVWVMDIASAKARERLG